MAAQNIDILIQAQDKTNQAFASASRGLDSFKGKIRDLEPAFQKMAQIGTVAFAGIGAAIVDTISTAGRFESLKMGLVAVSGSAEEAEKQLKRLNEVAKLPGLGFEEAISGSVNLQAAGLSAALSERSLMAFGNALATVGKGKDELKGVNLALAQIAAKGKVSAEEINQINERVPQIRSAMRAAFGTSDTEVLQDMGISVENFITGVVEQLEKLPKVTGGFRNSWENMTDSVNKAKAAIGDSFLALAGKLIDNFAKLADRVKEWADKNPELARTIGLIAIAFTGLVAILGFIGLAIIPITAAFTALSGPIGLILLGIAGIVAIGALLVKHWDEIKAALEDSGFLQVLRDIWENISTIWQEKILPALQKLNELFVMLKPLLEIVGKIVGVVIVVAFTAAAKAIEAIIFVIGTLASWFTKIVTYIQTTLLPAFSEVFDGIKNKIIAVKEEIKDLINWITSLMSKIGKTGASVGNAISSVVGKVINVNDGVISPSGTLVSTHPDDYIMAMKDPSKLSNIGGGVTVNITGGNFLDQDVALKLGDIIIQKLNMNMRGA